MAEFSREKNILHELVKACNAVKRKYNLLKYGKDTFEKAMEDIFKQIVEPLEKLVAKRSKDTLSRAVKHNEKYNKSIKSDEKYNKSIKSDEKYNKSIKSDEEHDDDDDMLEQDDTLQAVDTSYQSATSNDGYDESNNRHLQMLSQDRYVDKIYGIREENGQFMIGNSPIEFEGNYINVNGAKYATTHGLLELLITKQPSESQITTTDMENYRKILEVSSAHKKRYDGNEKILPHNSNKFKYFIAPMFEYSKQDAGVLP